MRFGVLAPGPLQVSGKSPRCPVGRRERLGGRWSRFGRVVEETDYQKEYGSRPLVTSPYPASVIACAGDQMSTDIEAKQCKAELECVRIITCNRWLYLLRILPVVGWVCCY